MSRTRGGLPMRPLVTVELFVKSAGEFSHTGLVAKSAFGKGYIVIGCVAVSEHPSADVTTN